ncbi:MAG TPA: NEW3 domain-containing protein [Acidimicrobiia bacterium]|nr:NEW3 domain-containing protein [Acidimicrobiia bacterium]
MRKVTYVIALTMTVLAVLAAPVVAQTATGLTISTPFPGVTTDAGSTAPFDLFVEAETRRTVDLAVEGVPEGWTATFRGGGIAVSQVATNPDAPPELRLDVIIPTGTAEGDYAMTVTATGGGETASLPIKVTVQGGAGGTVTLTPDFPGLQGPASETFPFNIEVSNDTPSEVILELAGEGPLGWVVEARPSGQSQASTITVDSGTTGRIQVTATPPVNVTEGTYDLRVTARGGDISVESPLVVVITGSYAMALTTIDERLNVNVTVGQPAQLQLVVENRGSAPLTNVEMSATPPSNWEVTFDQEGLATVGPGEAATVNATITPATGAIAGDYQITFRATVPETSANAEVRATVSPSAFGGLVGVGLILLVLASLAWVFRRFGRR